MKKFLALLLCAVMLVSMAAIASAEETDTGVYTFYNETGEKLTELYVYPVGSEDKGENQAAHWYDGKVVEFTAVKGTKLTVEFVTESGYVGTFDKLSIETAPISLLSADGMTGPTMIKFAVPDGTGVYTFYNETGEKLTELYVYPVGSEDKGENHAAHWYDGKVVEITAAKSTKLMVEFVTESGYVGTFDKLSIEVAPISLLSADGMTGPTMINFFVPQGTGSYTMYNRTGEALAELYIYPVDSEDKGENYAVDFEDGKVIEITAAKSTKLMVEFVTESGYVGTFDKLSIEVAPITLLSADGMTGPTMISFFAPAE